MRLFPNSLAKENSSTASVDRRFKAPVLLLWIFFFSLQKFVASTFTTTLEFKAYCSKRTDGQNSLQRVLRNLDCLPVWADWLVLPALFLSDLSTRQVSFCLKQVSDQPLHSDSSCLLEKVNKLFYQYVCYDTCLKAYIHLSISRCFSWSNILRDFFVPPHILKTKERWDFNVRSSQTGRREASGRGESAKGISTKYLQVELL